MPKIKDLIDFEEIKDVIDIDSDIETSEDKKNIVKDYIISDNLRDNLKVIAENISKPTHKSIQIIGGYGSGKSHLLAWIVSLLENNELTDDISDDSVKESFQKSLTRDFAVVQFELQPGASALSDFFFDRVEEQLKDKLDIDVPQRDTSRAEDFKRDIKHIIDAVKSKNPKMGLVVVIDEISDFLKQKSQQQIHRDMQFLRILGQVSKAEDFLFIGSMQENVFSNPRYIVEAESFGRVSERFYPLTISREDVKIVISQRLLKKSQSQRETIDELLVDYKKMFPAINSDPDEYINLFPIHPYVIDIFDELPYFEKRGVIQFVMSRVREVLDEEFPFFVTFDKVFDEINAKHTVRNLDDVRPIVEIVETLEGKMSLIEKNKREDARRLVKALAVLKLYGKTKNNGMVPEELANKLLITSSTIKNTDRIVVILDKLREVTSGQFVAKSDNNYFYLNIEDTPDYDVVIDRKIKNIPDGMEDEELLRLLKYTDLIDLEYAESYTRVFKDSSMWPDKKSFRLGHFIYDDGSEQVNKGDLDFNLVIKSPYQGSCQIASSLNTAIIHIGFSNELDEALKRLAATRLFIHENYSKGVMQKKHRQAKDAAESLLLEILIDAEIEIDGKRKKIKSVITSEPDSIDEFFHHVKEQVFNDYFTSTYKQYPRFLNQLSHENIKGEVESTIQELLSKGEKNLFSNAKNILTSLDLIDVDGNIDTGNSVYAQVILDVLGENKGKNVKVEDLVDKLSVEPFGLDNELIQLILMVLTFNGQINLRKKGGGTVTSSELDDVFKSGLKAFDSIPYATLETEFPDNEIIKLFRILDLKPGLVRNPKDRTQAVQEFHLKSIELKDSIDGIQKGFDEIKSKPNPIIDKEALSEKIQSLDEFPIDDFLKVKTVNDFKKVAYDDEKIQLISDKLSLISSIDDFFSDYNEFIAKEYVYMRDGMNWLEEYPDFFSEEDKQPLHEIRVACKPLVTEIANVLDNKQRLILKGKLQQFKRKYISLYYNTHMQTIGKGVHWRKLEELSQSQRLQRLRDMQAIKCINPLRLNKQSVKILSLSKAKCENLTEDHLKENYYCTWCSFPKNLKDITDINDEIESISKSLHEIEENWTETILSEIENYNDNISLLSGTEKQIVDQITSEKKLPEDITQETITSLNNLFSELNEVEISPQDIMDFVFKDSSVLDYESFSKMLDEYKENILGSNDKKNIRIKRKES